MKTYLSSDANPNYTARIIEIEKLVPHPNSDNGLQLAIVNAEEIVVDKSCQVGDIMLHFPIECQISAHFLGRNSLYRKGVAPAPTLDNKPKIEDFMLQAGVNRLDDKFGFFEANGRVRATRLRGVVSNGFLVPIDTLNCFEDAKLEYELNASFDSIEYSNPERKATKALLVRKYVPRGQRSRGSGINGKYRRRKNISDRILDRQWRFHYDTEKLENHLSSLYKHHIVHISQKVHGTSACFGRVLVYRTGSRLLRFLMRCLGIATQKYADIWSSRKVIKNHALSTNKNAIGYYSDDVWTIAYRDVIRGKLEDGITIYAEIIGYTPSGGGIQGEFDYGFEAPAQSSEYECGKHYGIFVYRITQTGEQGAVQEFVPDQIAAYCAQHNLSTVHTLAVETASALYPDIADLEDEEWRLAFYKKLKEDARFNIEGRARNCKNNVPEEGIVLRIIDTGEAYKLKSKKFLLKESADLDSGVENLENE